jgi:hypothetical protein
MNTPLVYLVGSTCLLALSTLVHADCSPRLTEQIVSTERIIDSLRPDKAGQIRVFASDGSKYSAGQAIWMKGQMRDVVAACTKGDNAAAMSHLQAVLDILKVHAVS